MTHKRCFLIVDDEQEVCNFFGYLLRKKGYQALSANTGSEALALLKKHRFNVALVDLMLPDSDGLTILKEIKKEQPQCEVIIITGYSTVKSAVEAIQLGAYDYLEKPFVDIDEMEKLIDRALNIRLEQERMAEIHRQYGFIVGKNQKMLNLLAAAQKIAKKNITVLIQGETGTGKEVLARYIHAVSHRSDRPFLAFNCGAFTETLLESELFGHEKGAFTGATGRKRGIFELAHRGTLFLDEIDSASPAIQIKLLRILETGEFLRVGGEELVKVDVRIITATNTDLASQVEAHKFREDLFYRLDVASLTIPPLRERKEDIPLLVNYFLERETVEKGLPAKRMDAEAMELLLKHPWPGNIRELANTIAQAVVFSKGPVIYVSDLPPRIRREEAVEASKKEEPAAAKPAVLIPSDHPEKEKLAELLQQFEELLLEKLEIKKGFDLKTLQESLKGWVDRLSSQIIAKALEATYDNQTKAARLLHITPRALRYSRQEKKSAPE